MNLYMKGKNMIRKSGFTLAEVLITLGIIGVVAAMTIPTLMNQTGQAEFKTGFKKAISVLNQAITMNVALDSTDFSNLIGSTTDTGSVFAMFNSRMNIARTATGAVTDMGATADTTTYPFNNANNYALFFTDGMAITFPSAATACTTAGQANCRIVVDVNGAKKPNRLTKVTTDIGDEFVMDFYNQQVTPHNDAAKYVLYN